MTEAATKFITPLTFQSLSKNKVVVDMFDSSYFEIEHISLAQKADVYVIVPATANTIAKMANGMADNLVTSTAIATTAKVIVCPAMNHNMYHHKAVKKNIETLKSYGYEIVDARPGLLACGVVGDGCLADNETILEAIKNHLK
jgi:phosphopantothenoylcysteine decarboxylase/phosphopantothenate--cysteine ligase